MFSECPRKGKGQSIQNVESTPAQPAPEPNPNSGDERGFAMGLLELVPNNELGSKGLEKPYITPESAVP
eukprot:10570042-Alexandrium_andersonii.AAC.1